MIHLMSTYNPHQYIMAYFLCSLTLSKATKCNTRIMVGHMMIGQGMMKEYEGEERKKRKKRQGNRATERMIHFS